MMSAGRMVCPTAALAGAAGLARSGAHPGAVTPAAAA